MRTGSFFLALGNDGDVTGATHDPSAPGDAVVDVTEHGVVGDGETDDTAAFQRAADAATPTGVLYVPAGCTARITDRIDVDCGGKDRASQFRLACDGAVTPETGADVFVHNARYPRLFLRVQGGGGDVDEDAALRLEDVSGGLVSAYGIDYPGTLLRLQWHRNDSDNSQPDVYPEFEQLSVGELRSAFCGRSLYAGPADDADEWAHSGGFGQINDVWEHRSRKNLTCRNVNDLCINQYENHTHDRRGTEQGVLIDHCAAVWIDRMLIGGTFAEASPQLELHNVEEARFGTLASSTDHEGDCYLLDSVNTTTIDAFPGGCSGVGIRVRETGHRETDHLSIRLKGEEADGSAVTIEDSVSGHVELAGMARDSGDETTPLFDLRGGEVVCRGLRSVDHPGPDLRAGDDATVHLFDCRLDEIEGSVATDRRY